MAETTKGASARKTTQQTKRQLQFYSYDPDGAPLFTINKGIPFDLALDQAQSFMNAAEHTLKLVAFAEDRHEVWGAYYMAQMASAIIEAMQCAIVEERRHV